jgi:hypothetical protein
MADFSDRVGFQTWLEARPDATRRHEAITLASRTAASVLPLLALSSRRARPFAQLCLASLRAKALLIIYCFSQRV